MSHSRRHRCTWFCLFLAALVPGCARQAEPPAPSPRMTAFFTGCDLAELFAAAWESGEGRSRNLGGTSSASGGEGRKVLAGKAVCTPAQADSILRAFHRQLLDLAAETGVTVRDPAELPAGAPVTGFTLAYSQGDRSGEISAAVVSQGQEGANEIGEHAVEIILVESAGPTHRP